jgi:hypothetical protein
MIQLTLSEQEANALIQLIDVAVKAGGLQTAQAGLALAGRVQSAYNEFKNPPVAKEPEAAA